MPLNVPTLHAAVPVGAAMTVAPFAEPQLPLTLSNAEQLAVVPPLIPVQDHDHGPEPDTAEAEPALQKFVVGTE